MGATSNYIGDMFLIAVFTLVAFFADFVFVLNVYQQAPTGHYVETQGRVLKSVVSTHRHRSRHGGAYLTYWPEIWYAFVLDDMRYTVAQFRHGFIETPSKRRAEQVVQVYRPGMLVPVFYNPTQPTEAVLSPGLSGQDYYWGLCLVPLNCFLGVFWWYGWFLFREHRDHPIAGGITLRQEGTKIFAQWEAAWLLNVVFVAAVVQGIIFVPNVGELEWNIEPSASMMALGVSILAAIPATWLYRKWRDATGHYGLMLDMGNQHISLPSRGTSDGAVVPFSKITSIEVETVVKTDSKGRKSYHFCPTVAWTNANGEGDSMKLVSWRDDEQANDFVAWLGSKTGHPA